MFTNLSITNIKQLASSILLAFILSSGVSASEQVGVKQSFNNDWLFAKDEQNGAEKITFNDTQWRKLDLPHDWSIEGPFDKKYNARNGGLPVFGTGWYRKHFTLPKSAINKQVSVIFDGAMDNAEVYVNGKLAGNRPFGYIAFALDITSLLKPHGNENIIAVKLSPKNYSARWYAGAGIYRNTWLEINNQVHVDNWGTFVNTPEVTKNNAKVSLTTKIVNAGDSTQVDVISEVKQADGNVVVRLNKTITVDTHATAELTQNFSIANPILWDIDNPHRYTITTYIQRNGTIVDTYDTPLGIRNIEFKADDGFWLNGRRVQIQGVCLHHDNGPLGAAVNKRAIERKFEIMKAMGVNSIRTSHNPPSPEFVEIADKMGMLLQVEAFDMWEMEKVTITNGYHTIYQEWHERDLRDMVKQSRNHPSVIMWSTGNEVGEQSEKDGWKVAKHLTDIVHDEDPTRLVTNGMSHFPEPVNNGFGEQIDIAGFNYKAYKYAEIKKQHPDWIMLGTETSSVVSTRGEYHFPLKKYRKHDSKYVSSYDIVTPPWAYVPDLEFENLKNNPFVMGEYIWTGFDYLGEPTPYGGRDHGNKAYWNGDWPARSSSFGAVDLVGFKKDRFYLYQSQWTTKPMVHVLPHWNWENKIGDIIPVMAYTNAEAVELFVNGKSMGRKVKGVDTVTIPVSLKHDKSVKTFESKYRVQWDVEYQPGDIKVVAYNQGKAVAEKQIKTAGLPAKIELIADRTEITADGQDISYIEVLIKDKDGNICPTADNKVWFYLKGEGEIAAVGNGDSVSEEPFVANYRRAFNGKAMVIVKGLRGKKGKINVRAYADRLQGANVAIVTKLAK